MFVGFVPHPQITGAYIQVRDAHDIPLFFTSHTRCVEYMEKVAAQVGLVHVHRIDATLVVTL